GMLSLPRPKITFVGKKVLVRMIEAVLGSHQDIGELADADDLVVDRGGAPDQALSETRCKPLGIAIILDPQHRVHDIRHFIPYPGRDATPVGILCPSMQGPFFPGVIHTNLKIERFYITASTSSIVYHPRAIHDHPRNLCCPTILSPCSRLGEMAR